VPRPEPPPPAFQRSDPAAAKMKKKAIAPLPSGAVLRPPAKPMPPTAQQQHSKLDMPPPSPAHKAKPPGGSLNRERDGDAVLPVAEPNAMPAAAEVAVKDTMPIDEQVVQLALLMQVVRAHVHRVMRNAGPWCHADFVTCPSQSYSSRTGRLVG